MSTPQNLPATQSESKNHKLWRILAWICSVVFLIAAFGSLLQGNMGSGIFALIIGLILLPPLNRWIRSRSNGKFTRGITASIAGVCLIGLGVFANKDMAKQKAEEDRLAAIEQDRVDSVQRIEEAKQKEYDAAKGFFLESYPYVDGDSYDRWMTINHDSSTQSHLTLKAFLSMQRRIYDSTVAAKRSDSIEAARRFAEYERKRKAEEATEQKQQATVSAPSTPTRSVEYYDGYEVHTGRRGGKYIIKNGRKVYLSSMK